jgi:hypothetical protein
MRPAAKDAPRYEILYRREHQNRGASWNPECRRLCVSCSLAGSGDHNKHP